MARPPRRPRRAGAAPRVRRRRTSSASCARSASRDFVRTRTGERVDARRRLEVTIARHDRAGRRSARRLAARARRRHARGCSTRTTPGPAISTRCARSGPFDAQMRAVLGRDLVSRSPTTSRRRDEARSRADKRINEMERAQHYVECGRRAPTCFRARARRASSTTTCSRSTTSTAIRPTSFPTRPCSSTSSTAAGIDRARSSFPVRSIELDGGECKVTQPDADDDEVTRPFTDKRAYLDEYRARLGDVARPRSARRGRTAGATSSPSSRRGSNRCWSARRSRRPASPGNVVLDVGDADANVCIDFVESRGARRGAANRTSTRSTSTARLIEALLDATSRTGSTRCSSRAASSRTDRTRRTSTST